MMLPLEVELRMLCSGRRQDVDHAACDQVARLGRVGRHVRRGGMGSERLGALPFLDYHEGVGPKFRLETADAVSVDGGAILDATLLGMHRRYVGAERFEDLFAVMTATTWIMSISPSM
jgi:hypothetical protein